MTVTQPHKNKKQKPPINYALPGDGRKSAAKIERRRLLHAYLRGGPKNFFKSLETITRELINLWPEMGWSRATVKRILADLKQLGLMEPLGRRLGKNGSQGTRIRRINIEAKRESEPSAHHQVTRNSQVNTANQCESEPSVSGQNGEVPMDKPVIESEPSTTANLSLRKVESEPQRFILNSYSDLLGLREVDLIVYLRGLPSLTLALQGPRTLPKNLGELLSLEPLLESEKASLNQRPDLLWVWWHCYQAWLEIGLPLDPEHLPGLYTLVWRKCADLNISVPGTFGIISRRVHLRRPEPPDPPKPDYPTNFHWLTQMFPKGM